MTVREFLTEYNKKMGWKCTEDELKETLVYAGKRVKKYDKRVAKKWQIMQEVVSEINGTYIKYDINRVDIDLAYFVKRKERQVTEVYYE